MVQNSEMPPLPTRLCGYPRGRPPTPSNGAGQAGAVPGRPGLVPRCLGRRRAEPGDLGPADRGHERLAGRVAHLQLVGRGVDLGHIRQALLGPCVAAGGQHGLALDGHLLEDHGLGPGHVLPALDHGRLAVPVGAADHLGPVLAGDGAVVVQGVGQAFAERHLVDQEADLRRHPDHGLDVRGGLDSAARGVTDGRAGVDPHLPYRRVNAVAALVGPDVPVGVERLLEQGDGDPVAEVPPPVQVAELVGVGELAGGEGTARPPRRRAGPRADAGGPAAGRSRTARGPG